MLRRTAVVSSFALSLVVAVAACAVNDLSSPDVRPSETTNIQAAGPKSPRSPVAGLQFGQFPAPAGELASIAYAADGTFTGTFVLSCADPACGQPQLAHVGGTYKQPGNSHDVDVHVTSITLPTAPTYACKQLEQVAHLKHLDGEVDEGTAGGVLTIQSSNLCTGASYALAQNMAQTVTPSSGGTVTAPNGASVALPPGAVSGNTTISVTPSPGAPAAPGTTAVGTPVVLGPEGTQFQAPVTVTLPIDPTQLPAGATIADAVIYTAPAGTKNFTLLPTTVVDATHVAALTTHFSLFTVGVPTNPDGGVNCNQLVANILGQPLQPPYRVAGIDLSNGDAGTPGTIDELAQEAPGCLTLVDQPYFQDGGGGIAAAIANEPNFQPGYRYALLGTQLSDGGVDPNQISVYYDMQPSAPGGIGGNLFQYNLGSEYTGGISFKSRAALTGSGRYGSHQYFISIPTGVERCDVQVDGGSCNPQPWPAPAWDPNNSGPFNTWADEIYDGIMATYAPSTPDLGRPCQGTPTTIPARWGETAGACLVLPNDNTGTGYIGVRPLLFYIELQDSTNDYTGVPNGGVKGFYGFVLPAGFAGCSTPLANAELRDYGGYGLPYSGMSFLSGINLNSQLSNAAGLTLGEIQSNFACGAGTSVPALDPGYGAVAWGPQNEITLEYNTGSGANANVAYKMIGSSGYYGTATGTSYGTGAGGGNDVYTVGVGVLLKNGAPLSIDWTNPGPALTQLVNGFYYNVPPFDTDCTNPAATQTGLVDCVIGTDSLGNTTVTFPFGTYGWVGTDDFLTFAPGTQVPSMVGMTNPGGQ